MAQEEKANDNGNQKEQASPLMKEYLSIGAEVKQELDRLYTTTAKYTESSNTTSEYEIQDKSFGIRTLVSYSSDTKHKKDPMIWYTESVCPGSPEMIYESWTDSQHRLQWDSHLSDSSKVMIEDTNPDIFILHSCTKAAAGGMISPRDFVDLLSIYRSETSVQIASRSIVREDIPNQKGFVRGTVVLSGLLFETLSDDERESLKLPKLMVSGKDKVDMDVEEEKESKTECEWTRIRYIVQTDIKGWIPSSVINATMSSTNNGMMRDLCQYVMQKRLKL